MRILCYNHKERTVTSNNSEYPDDRTFEETISIDEARKLDEAGEVADCNLAFLTLRMHDWDPSQVEQYYREQD